MTQQEIKDERALPPLFSEQREKTDSFFWSRTDLRFKPWSPVLIIIMLFVVLTCVPLANSGELRYVRICSVYFSEISSETGLLVECVHARNQIDLAMELQ